jgi:hypothetical protein
MLGGSDTQRNLNTFGRGENRIIADDWLAPIGPKWTEISLRIAERDVRNIEQILAIHEPHHTEIGLRAQRAWLKYFADESYFNYIVDACVAMKARQIVPESVFWCSRHILQHLVGSYVIQAQWYAIQAHMDQLRHSIASKVGRQARSRIAHKIKTKIQRSKMVVEGDG